MGARKPPGREAWGRVLLDSLEEFRKEDERSKDNSEKAAHQSTSLVDAVNTAVCDMILDAQRVVHVVSVRIGTIKFDGFAVVSEIAGNNGAIGKRLDGLCAFGQFVQAPEVLVLSVNSVRNAVFSPDAAKLGFSPAFGGVGETDGISEKVQLFDAVKLGADPALRQFPNDDVGTVEAFVGNLNHSHSVGSHGVNSFHC